MRTRKTGIEGIEGKAYVDIAKSWKAQDDDSWGWCVKNTTAAQRAARQKAAARRAAALRDGRDPGRALRVYTKKPSDISVNDLTVALKLLGPLLNDCAVFFFLYGYTTSNMHPGMLLSTLGRRLRLDWQASIVQSRQAELVTHLPHLFAGFPDTHKRDRGSWLDWFEGLKSHAS